MIKTISNILFEANLIFFKKMLIRSWTRMHPTLKYTHNIGKLQLNNPFLLRTDLPKIIPLKMGLHYCVYCVHEINSWFTYMRQTNLRRTNFHTNNDWIEDFVNKKDMVKFSAIYVDTVWNQLWNLLQPASHYWWTHSSCPRGYWTYEFPYSGWNISDQVQ